MFDKYKDYRNYKDIKMPEDMKNDILASMQEYKPAKKKMTRRKRTFIIAAALSVMLVLMGAGIVSNLIEVTLFDFGGNTRKGKMLIRDNSIYSKSPEIEAFEKEFWDNGHSIFYITKELSEDSQHIEYSVAFREIQEYEELKNYINNLGGNDIFKLPEYLPDGFEFENARIDFAHSDKINYEELKPIYSQDKDGYVYEKYVIPEILENICSINIRYINSEKLITYYMSFRTSDIDTIVFSASEEKAEVEILNMPQFDRAALSTNSRSNYYSFSAAKLIEQRFNITIPVVPSRMWREFENKKKGSYKEDLWTSEYGAIVYNISSINLSLDEIIKMAESIK